MRHTHVARPMMATSTTVTIEKGTEGYTKNVKRLISEIERHSQEIGKFEVKIQNTTFALMRQEYTNGLNHSRALVEVLRKQLMTEVGA